MPHSKTGRIFGKPMPDLRPVFYLPRRQPVVDGTELQARQRRLVAKALADETTTEHEYEAYAWIEVVTNRDEFRKLCDAVLSEDCA